MEKLLEKWFELFGKEAENLSLQLWSRPEISMEEQYAKTVTAEFFRRWGFVVKTIDIYDLQEKDEDSNAVVAVYGNGSPNILLIGELDALNGLGQEAVPFRKAVPGPGHGCGHNLMMGATAAAAAAVKYAMEQEHMPGTITFLGCPAEETGTGKTWLAKNGFFQGFDACFTYHPGEVDFTFDDWSTTAITRLLFSFTGIPAHAAGMPWAGRSALDAAELMNVGVNYLREHVPPDCRMHYIYKDGGQAPNIVPEHASVCYFARSQEENHDDLVARIKEVARGAAIMTETKAYVRCLGGCHSVISNSVLSRFLYEAAQKVEPLTYNAEEDRFARELYRNVHGKEPETEDILPVKLKPREEGKVFRRGGSTDLGDVSRLMPVMLLRGGGRPYGQPAHHWGVTACSGMSIGQKAANYAGKILAQGIYELFSRPEIIEAAWKEWESKKLPPYVSWVEEDGEVEL